MSRKRVPMTPEEKERRRWELSAARENERRRRKASLFVWGGIVPLATPEERQALLVDARARAKENDRAAREREAVRAVDLRARARAVVTPTEFLVLEEKAASKWWEGRPDAFWGYALGILTSDPAREAPPPQPVVSAQASLFVVTPSNEVVAAVSSGRAIPLEDLRGRYAPGAACVAVKAPRQTWTCPGCGWVRTPDQTARERLLEPIRLGIHPDGCPYMVALLGCGHAHGADRPCAKCIEAALTCQREGCIPGPSPWSYVAGEVCTRCRRSMRARAA